MKTTEEAAERIGAAQISNLLARAAIPPETPRSASRALYWTDLETWGALRGDTTGMVEDGEEAPLADSFARRRGRTAHHRKAQVLGIGPDGRKIYTADKDARAGHRSSTSSRAAGIFTGYYLHLVVQTRDIRSTNFIDRVALGSDVPAVVTTLSLDRAGEHPARSIVPLMVAAKQSGECIKDVVLDRGYSQLAPATCHYLLQKAGIHSTFDLVTWQRGIQPVAGDHLLVDGNLFSRYLPPELGGLPDKGEPLILPMPPPGAYEEEKLKYEKRFNRRARYRYGRHQGPRTDGSTRWKCPFELGTLRSRAFPKTMRRPKTVPLVSVPKDAKRCCSGVLTATPTQLRLWQQIPFGTTAWRISYGRRQAVESANAGLKGQFVDIGRKGFVRVFGKAKISLLLGFTIAGYNLYLARSFQESHSAPTNGQGRTRRSRRKGTWQELLPTAPDVPAPGPP
jgi:hypothetical protein